MKLVLIGGGGVRAPEFVRGALAFTADLDLQEIWMMDIDPSRLEAIAAPCIEIVRQSGQRVSIRQTLDLDEALADAGMIVATIRVGQEKGRVLDERIALELGVLGQETTGPGGLGMAMRSIPALLNIAARAEMLAPQAWIFNFTNPAGMVTQALIDSGYRRVVGICDSANTAQYDVARWLDHPVDAVKTQVFGLNHLSWTRRAMIDGRDVLPALLRDDDFVNDTHLRFFGPAVVQRLGLYLNEYLYYYYFRDVAVQRILAQEEVRGEEVERLSRELYEKLRGQSLEDSLRIYESYKRRRNASYMAYAEHDPDLREIRLNPDADIRPVHVTQAEVGGYAGVALRTGLALKLDHPLRIALNVPNQEAIVGMRPDDVVEVTCTVDGGGIQPVYVGEIPEGPFLLMRQVKYFERLAVRAILERDRALAVEALVAHPLVGSYERASKLVTNYLKAHSDYVGEWR